MKKQVSTLLMSLSCALLSLGSGCLNAETKVSPEKTEEKIEAKQVDITTKEIAMNEKVTLPSGLAYIITTNAPAEAAQPTKGTKVTVHYTGWLDKDGEPGKKFDSSVDRGQAFAFNVGVGYVIKGWDEGVITMRVGEKRRLFIPAKLGYGARGAGADIPPHADLIFDVELLSI